MQLRNCRAFVIAIAFLPILILSCKKNDKLFSGGNPKVELPGDPPVYLAYKVRDYESLNLSFKYDEFPNKVSVYYDDTLTTGKYDHLFATYTFNTSGYLTANAFYNDVGVVKSSISIERSDNSISQILVQHAESGVAQTDTFKVSFTDSSGAPGYTFMNVDYGKYFSGIPVTMKFTYHNNATISSLAGMYTSGDDAIFFPSFDYTYNALNQLSSKQSDLYYGSEYSYETGGNGLDSLFRILGGKDWHYLENILNYDENTSIFFYPLYVTLSTNNNVDIDIYMHRYGVLSDIRSIPNGSEYPRTEVFRFVNSFGDSKRLLQSTIYNNDEEYASYQFQY
ncbi:MAG: hypothetical protein QM763_07125 [Agriterribacter sp.]